MGLDRVSSGRNLPDDVNVIIEIPAHGEPIKYEVDKESGAMFVDRFMSTAMHYPCNYGYIPHTLSDDGDPVDVLVVTPIPLITGVVVRCRPIGMLKMTDEAGVDAKLADAQRRRPVDVARGRLGQLAEAVQLVPERDVARHAGDDRDLLRVEEMRRRRRRTSSAARCRGSPPFPDGIPTTSASTAISAMGVVTTWTFMCDRASVGPCPVSRPVREPSRSCPADRR